LRDHKKYTIYSNNLQIFSDICEQKPIAANILLQSINILSEILHIHYNKKVFLFIDEYHAPINSCLLEEK